MPVTSATEVRKEEQRKFGVYFDDNYDYLQHLKDPKNVDDVHWEEVETFNLKKDDKIVPEVKKEGDKVSKSLRKLISSKLIVFIFVIVQFEIAEFSFCF